MVSLIEILMDAPPVDGLPARVAVHIGAVYDPETGAMPCPACGGDFGPSMALETLRVYLDGFLPGAPLLTGVCLDCGHCTEPEATPIDSELLEGRF